MSYALDYPIASDAPASARAAFVRRTYGHLAGAVLGFVGLETLLLRIPGIENVVRPMLSGSWMLVLLAFMAAGWIARVWANSNTSQVMQYLGLSLYVVAWAIMFLPLLYIAVHFTSSDVIPTAGILTLSIFGGLTIAVFVTRGDYSYLGPVISIASCIAFGVIVASTLFGFSLGLIFCFALVGLACAAIIYNTSNVLHHYRTDQHVGAALELFASVALLFWYILQIVMSRRD
jgi:FtsH-binding integral membrane protein